MSYRPVFTAGHISRFTCTSRLRKTETGQSQDTLWPTTWQQIASTVYTSKNI